MAAKKRSTSKDREQAEAKANYRLYRKWLAEKEAPLPDGFAEQVEKDLTGAGKYAPPRRMALALLSRPFSELAKAVRTDRDAAIGVAAALEAIGPAVKQYEALSQWLNGAAVRAAMLVAIRKDTDQILAEVRRG